MTVLTPNCGGDGAPEALALRTTGGAIPVRVGEDVLIVQRDTVSTSLTEIDARNQYVRARTTLEQVTGRILKSYDLDIEDAVAGAVRREPDALPVLDRRR